MFSFNNNISLGFVLHDKAGKLHEMRPQNPNIDPACFPLLHIRGTQGWRFGLKKRKYLTREGKDQLNMERSLEDVDDLNNSTDFATTSTALIGQDVNMDENMDEEETIGIADVYI
jgi:hypothetical protein